MNRVTEQHRYEKLTWRREKPANCSQGVRAC
jgi:hypothetical protein